ncbi:MAG: hypothetical protein ACLPQS_17125 [Acidimicrobiales bacterium]
MSGSFQNLRKLRRLSGPLLLAAAGLNGPGTGLISSRDLPGPSTLVSTGS